MTELQNDVIKVFKNNFPLDSKPQKADASLSDIQFCHNLADHFAIEAMINLPNSNELDAANICLILRDSLTMEEWEHFFKLYQFGKHPKPSVEANKYFFLLGIFYRELGLIKPSKAIFLGNLTVSETEKVYLYDFVIHMLIDLNECQKVLDVLSQIQQGHQESYSTGLNNWSYQIDTNKVILTNDGDGTFSDDEIITISLSHSDFLKIIRQWQFTLQIFLSRRESSVQ